MGNLGMNSSSLERFDNSGSKRVEDRFSIFTRFAVS